MNSFTPLPPHGITGAMALCDDCDTLFIASDAEPIQDPDIRLSAGDEIPVGDCPICGACAFVVRPEQPAITIRPATDSESVLIRAAIKKDERYSGGDLDERIDALHNSEIMVRTDYISDGPGFVGELAVVFWGEPQFVTILCKYSGRGISPDQWQTIEVES